MDPLYDLLQQPPPTCTPGHARKPTRRTSLVDELLLPSSESRELHGARGHPTGREETFALVRRSRRFALSRRGGIGEEGEAEKEGG